MQFINEKLYIKIIFCSYVIQFCILKGEILA